MSLRELVKKWRLRLSLALLFSSFFILFDEAVKEGYVIDLLDFINPAITHEKLFLVLLLAGLFLGLRKK